MDSPTLNRQDKRYSSKVYRPMIRRRCTECGRPYQVVKGEDDGVCLICETKWLNGVKNATPYGKENEHS